MVDAKNVPVDAMLAVRVEAYRAVTTVGKACTIREIGFVDVWADRRVRLPRAAREPTAAIDVERVER